MDSSSACSNTQVVQCPTSGSLLNVLLFQVKIVAMNEDVALRSALDQNLKSTVTAAFLMLPESFSEEDLFTEIAGLSYSG